MKNVKWRPQVQPRPAYLERRYHHQALHRDPEATTELVEMSIVNVANETVVMTGRLRDTSQYLHHVSSFILLIVCFFFTLDGGIESAQEVQEDGGIDYFIQPILWKIVYTPYVSCERHCSSICGSLAFFRIKGLFQDLATVPALACSSRDRVLCPHMFCSDLLML